MKKGAAPEAAAEFEKVLRMTNHPDVAEPAHRYLRDLGPGVAVGPNPSCELTPQGPTSRMAEVPRRWMRSGTFTPARHRRHPDQGRTRALPDSRVRHPAAPDLGHLRRPDVRPRHPDAHPARRLPRAVRHEDRPRHPVRPPAAGAGHPADGHRDELRRLVAERQSGAGARGARGGDFDHDGRRRHARRRAGRIACPGLRSLTQPLRDRRPPPAPVRRYRADHRPGGQTRHRRPAPGLEGLRRDRPHPRPASRRRSALALPPPRFSRARRHGDQDRGAARGDRLAGADLRQDGRRACLRRRPPRRQGRCRRSRRRWDGRGHRRLARTPARAHRHPDAGRRLRGPRARSRTSAFMARSSS